MTTKSPTEPVRTDVCRRWPDFVVIGAAKAGTSSLFDYLRRHPQIFNVSKKEPCYFCLPDPTAEQSEQYLRKFKDASDEELCGEASTPYTRWPQVPGVPGRIVEANPRVKLIYIMRHPVDRAYSQFVHQMTREVYLNQPVTTRFEQYIEEDSTCLDSSRYADQIEQYLAHVPREAMLFLFNDDLINNSAGTLNKVFRFLGIDESHDVFSEGRLTKNETAHFFDSQTGTAMAQKIKSRIPLYDSIARLIPQKLRHAAYLHLRKSGLGDRHRESLKPAPMRPETRTRLLEYFREPNVQLEKLLGVDVSRWSK